METVTKSIDINGMVSGDVVSLGTFKARTLFVDFSGGGYTSGDSTWELVQSVDNSNWDSIAGTGLTAGNAKQTIDVGEVFNALYLGVKLVAKNTETTGIGRYMIVIK